MSFSWFLNVVFFISCSWTVEFVETKRDERHGKNSIGSSMRIFVDIEEECIGLIGSSRETEGRYAEETG